MKALLSVIHKARYASLQNRQRASCPELRLAKPPYYMTNKIKDAEQGDLLQKTDHLAIHGFVSLLR